MSVFNEKLILFKRLEKAKAAIFKFLFIIFNLYSSVCSESGIGTGFPIPIFISEL